jgi:hypothetical protein
MARGTGTYKPGEAAPAAGTYACYVCALRKERSACEMKAGQLFLACPRCLERKVPEWDMLWKPDAPAGNRARRLPIPWPGSLARSA